MQSREEGKWGAAISMRTLARRQWFRSMAVHVLLFDAVPKMKLHSLS